MHEPLNNKEQELLEKIKLNFFSCDLTQVNSSQGYKVTDSGITFGYRVGPKFSVIEGLLHEMGHFLETTQFDKLLQYAYGLHIKSTQQCLGQIFYEPKTWQASQCECRAVIWQELFCQFYNVEFDLKDFCKAFQYMPDWHMVPRKGYQFKVDDYYSLDTGEKFTGNYKFSEELKMETLYDYIDSEKSTGKYSLELIEPMWKQRVDYIKTNFKKHTNESIAS